MAIVEWLGEANLSLLSDNNFLTHLKNGCIPDFHISSALHRWNRIFLYIDEEKSIPCPSMSDIKLRATTGKRKATIFAMKFDMRESIETQRIIFSFLILLF